MATWQLAVLLAVGQLPAITSLSREDVSELNLLLSRSDIQAELRVSSAQVSAGTMTDRYRQLLAEVIRLQPKLTLAEKAEYTHRLGLESLRTVLDSLRPDQILRLQELRVQYQALNEGTPDVLERIVDLTEEQKAQIRENEAKLGEDLRELLWSLHRQSQREFQQLMTPQQRAEWQKKIGEEFRFQSISTGLSPLGVLP